ncbi:hypothetical protein ACFV6G_26360 [Streptomyces lavendulae]|uniref:hypothetical protein n=1 Tax=Streptomyces lavendulae TaxID=1914 RepID=UPI003683879B
MATRALARVLQAGAGSLVLEERVRTFTDPVTGLDVEERQVRYLRPDWRAAAWWLARIFPEDYGPPSPTRVSTRESRSPKRPWGLRCGGMESSETVVTTVRIGQRGRLILPVQAQRASGITPCVPGRTASPSSRSGR